jgi:diadenylate cyclase
MERIAEIASAAQDLSENKTGALIVFERSTGLRSYIETGTPLNAQISRDLIISIFYAQNPLHDGAVIIRDARIDAARCILPVSSNMNLGSHLGLRHRAAVGITEVSDAFVIVVSEETGRVSVASNGELRQGITIDQLREYVTEAISPHLASEPEAPPSTGN